MYRNKDKESLKKFSSHINKHEVSKETAWNLYYKNCCLFDLWDFARAKVNCTVNIGYGNILSDVLVVLESKDQIDRLNFISGIADTVGKNLSDLYVTFYNKTDNMKLNNILFNKEISLIEPNTIVCFDDLKLDKNKAYILTLPTLKVKKAIEMISNKELDYNNPELLGKLKRVLRGSTINE